MYPLCFLEKKETSLHGEQPISFSLRLQKDAPSLPLPTIEGEMELSFDPPRPEGALRPASLLIRLAKSAQSKRVALPFRVDLLYAKDLIFASAPSQFWVELRLLGNQQIEGRVFVATAAEEKREVETFVATAQESPIQSAQEFSEGSPFRVLAEAKWWGRDLFREKYGGGALAERLEIVTSASVDFFELENKDWLVWQEGKWQKIQTPQQGKDRPIAHIISREKNGLVLEGWDLEGHVRFSLAPAQPSPLKSRSEELFSSLRIRSEKQISCLLEKQCLILRVGDWAVKRDGRWKVLRRKEEREACLNGAIGGELFVFDRIDVKGGQKVIQGNLFNPERSQVFPLEMTVNVQKRSAQNKQLPWLRKGKMK